MSKKGGGKVELRTRTKAASHISAICYSPTEPDPFFCEFLTIFHSNKGEEAYLVLPDPALAPDEDGLHLRRHHLHAGAGGARDAQLEGDAGVRGHTAPLRVPASQSGIEMRHLHGGCKNTSSLGCVNSRPAGFTEPRTRLSLHVWTYSECGKANRIKRIKK